MGNSMHVWKKIVTKTSPFHNEQRVKQPLTFIRMLSQIVFLVYMEHSGRNGGLLLHSFLFLFLFCPRMYFFLLYLSSFVFISYSVSFAVTVEKHGRITMRLAIRLAAPLSRGEGGSIGETPRLLQLVARAPSGVPLD